MDEKVSTAKATAKIIDILNSFSKESVPEDVIRSMASTLGFENAKQSIENLNKVERVSQIEAEKLPSDFDTKVSKELLIKGFKAKAILAMCEGKDKYLYDKYNSVAEDFNKVSLELVKKYENDVDIVLSDLATMIETSGKDSSSIIRDAMNTKLSAV